jgi:hypothetical protein
MEREAVREYVEHARSTIDESPQMGEATTKAAVLRDFLDLLGWVIPTNTQLEYSVKAFGRTFKVDYALVLEGTPVAFLEAKGVDTPLTEEHQEQLQEYMKSEDVNLGILTNGEEYVFLRRQVIDSKVRVNVLGKATLQNLPTRVPILTALTKDAIQNDEWVTFSIELKNYRGPNHSSRGTKDVLRHESRNLWRIGYPRRSHHRLNHKPRR